MVKKRGHSDYDGWILRLIDKLEDIMFTSTLNKWLDFARDKIEKYHGAELSDSQVETLMDKYNSGAIWDKIETDAGVRIERPFKIDRMKNRIILRDVHKGAKGRFISKKTANEWLNVMIINHQTEKWHDHAKYAKRG